MIPLFAFVSSAAVTLEDVFCGRVDDDDVDDVDDDDSIENILF